MLQQQIALESVFWIEKYWENNPKDGVKEQTASSCWTVNFLSSQLWYITSRAFLTMFLE